MRFSCFVAVLAASAIALPVNAQSVNAKDPQSIIHAFQAAGYKALLDKDDIGDPMIESASSGNRFYVYFYDCTHNKECQTIQFRASYKDEKPIPAAKMEDWNRNKRYTKAYLDDSGTAVIEMDLNLDFGGISRDLFQDNLDLWISLLASFEKHLDW